MTDVKLAVDKRLREILWESLEGGDYDLDALKRELTDESQFEELGLDSLDLTEFYLRLQDQFGTKIRQEEYDGLNSLAAIQSFISDGAVAH